MERKATNNVCHYNAVAIIDSVIRLIVAVVIIMSRRRNVPLLATQ